MTTRQYRREPADAAGGPAPWWQGTGSAWIAGHRGSPRELPQNSIPAFEAAVAAGADAVELDVRRTADGVLVVCHAASVRRVPVASVTYAELTALAAVPEPSPDRFGRVAGGMPPRLEDVLVGLAGRTHLDVEIKEPGHEAEVLAMLERTLPAGSYLVTSFHARVVARCKELAPGVPAGLLLGSPVRDGAVGVFPFGRAARCHADLLVSSHAVALRWLLRRAERRGVPVAVYTVNRPRRLRSLLQDRRVAGVITDIPRTAAGIRGGLGG